MGMRFRESALLKKNSLFESEIFECPYLVSVFSIKPSRADGNTNVGPVGNTFCRV